MKVIYQFNCEIESDDNYELSIFQRAPQMVRALSDMSDYVRSIRKGWEEPTVEEMEDKISNMIVDSGYYEIE